MSDLRLVVMNSGLQLIGELTLDPENNKVILSKPAQLIFAPRSEEDAAAGKMGMALTPFLHYVNEWERGIPLSILDVLTVVTPSTEIANHYRTLYGSNIILPPGAGLVR